MLAIQVKTLKIKNTFRSIFFSQTALCKISIEIKYTSCMHLRIKDCKSPTTNIVKNSHES